MAKGAYIGVDSEYYPAFADNTWAQIIKACQKNEVPSSWDVGDQKNMTINGKDYPIDIIGIKHDTYADGSGAAPLTFQMHDIYTSSYAMNSSNTNSGGWESTAIRTTRLPAILALMPSEVQAGIKEVNKITGQGGSNFATETTADKLFILSVNEIFGYEPSDVAKGEGSQYAYYADGNSTQKKQNGEYNYWWTRSPVANNSSGFFQVRTDGSRVSTNYPSGTYGVAFAFCFGGTSELDTEFPSLGSVARKVKKSYIGIENFAKRNLPSGYTQVGYIESTGTQYIDTGFKPNGNTRVVCDFQITRKHDGTRAIFGARDNTTTYLYAFWHIASNAFRTDYYGKYENMTVSAELARTVVDKNKNITIIGDSSLAYTATESQTPYNLYLFAVNKTGTATSYSYVKVYSCQIYDNGTLVRDYVPCINASGVAGLYDMANNTFSADAAGGAFVAGSSAESVARKIKKAYIGVGGVARLWWSSGDPISLRNVGDSVYMNVNGERKEFIIVQKGNPNSSIYDASCDGVWLLMKDLYVQMAYASSSSNYAPSAVQSYLNGTFLKSLDTGVQSTIKQVKIPYINWKNDGNTNAITGSSGLSQKVFLLSAVEIGVSGSYVPGTDGVRLAYFTAGGSAIAYPAGSREDASWWTRTPYCRGVSYVACVLFNGTQTNSGCAATVYYVRPAMILPNEALVDDDGNVVS